VVWPKTIQVIVTQTQHSVIVGERLKSSLALDVKGESIGLSEFGVGGKDQSRSSSSRMYQANISVLRASISIRLGKALCSAEADATEP